jgi:O-antigen/teichoic acid export membrane protein
VSWAVILASTSTDELRGGLTIVTRGTLLVFVSAICLVALTFVSRVLLVRSPSADWNAFSLELTFASLLTAAGNLGLPNSVARSLPHAATDAERRTIVRTAIAATAGSAVLIALTLWLLAPQLATRLGIPALHVGLEFFSIAIAATLVAGAFSAIFRGYADVVPYALFLQVVNPGLFVVFLLAALLLPARGISYTYALAAYALANAATLAALVVYALRRLPRHLPSGPHAPEARGRLFRFTAPLFIAGVMITLAGTGDTVVLGIYHPAEVGTYTASLTLARLIAVGIGSMSYIFLPVATRFLRRANPLAVRVTYATVTKWLLTFSMPLFFLFDFIPGRSLGLVFGSAYSTVVVPLQITVAGAFVATILGPGSTTQIAYGRVRLLAINSVVAGVVDVGLALALVPAHGYDGAAVAWGLSTLLYAALCLGELMAFDGIRLFGRHFVVPLVATSIPFAVLLLVLRTRIPEWTLPPLGLAMAAVFVLAVFVTRSIDEGDRTLLGAIEDLIGRQVPFVRRLARWAGVRGSRS